MYAVNLNTNRVTYNEYVDLNDPMVKVFKCKADCLSYINARLNNLKTLSLSTKDGAKKILINIKAQKLKNSALLILNN